MKSAPISGENPCPVYTPLSTACKTLSSRGTGMGKRELMVEKGMRWPSALISLAQCPMRLAQGSVSHLLHILLALFHFVLELFLLLRSVGLIRLAVGFAGHGQLLLLACQVIGFLGCLQLWGRQGRDIRVAVTAPCQPLCLWGGATCLSQPGLGTQTWTWGHRDAPGHSVLLSPP